MKDRTSKTYVIPRIPAKYLSLLKGTIHEQKTHTSSGLLPALVLIACKSLFPEIWHHAFLDIPLQFLGRKSQWKGKTSFSSAPPQLSIFLFASRSSFSTLCGQKKALSECGIMVSAISHYFPHRPTLRPPLLFYSFSCVSGSFWTFSCLTTTKKPQQTIHDIVKSKQYSIFILSYKSLHWKSKMTSRA